MTTTNGTEESTSRAPPAGVPNGDPDNPSGHGTIAAAALIMVGCLVLWLGGRQNSPSALIVGPIIIGVAVLVQHKLLPKTRPYESEKTKPRKLALTLICGAATAVFVGVTWQLASLATIGVGLAAGAVAPTSLWVDRSATKHALEYVVAGLVASLAGWGLLAFTDQKLLGPLFVLAGLIIFRAGVLPAIGVARSTDARRVGGAGLVCFFAGVGFMGWAIRWSTVPPGLIGTFLISLALMTLAVAWPAIDYWPIGVPGSRAVGILLGFAGVFVIWAGGQADLQAWGIMLVLAGFGVALARSGELVVFGLLISIALVWSLTDRSADEALDPNPDADGRILAIGDSYISGEGAPTFFPGTDVVGANHNECRRAPSAYPYLVAVKLGKGLDFLACSGAKTSEVLPVPSELAEGDAATPNDCDSLLKQDPSDHPGQMPESPSHIAGAVRQIYAICQLDNRDAIEVVLVSVGGNDSRFSEIARGCFLPGTCAELRELWLGNVETIGPKIREVYRSVQAVLPGVPIVAMPYPIMLNPEPCGWSLLAGDEHEFLVEFVTILNQQVRVSAQLEGVHYFEEGLFVFENANARICDQDDASDTVMNLIALQPTGGDAGARLNPSTWIHGSMHPRDDGHELTAKALEGYIKDVIAGRQTVEANVDALLEIGGIRQSQPVSVNPKEFNDLALVCKALEPGPFAKSIVLIDEQVGEDGRLSKITLADATSSSQLCLRHRDGWTRVEAGEAGFALDENNVLSFAPLPPEDRDDSEQWLIYRDRRGDTQVRIVGFCSTIEECPDTVSEWTSWQVSGAARTASAPVVISILAGWFITIGFAPRSMTEIIVQRGKTALRRQPQSLA